MKYRRSRSRRKGRGRTRKLRTYTAKRGGIYL